METKNKNGGGGSPKKIKPRGGGGPWKNMRGGHEEICLGGPKRQIIMLQ